MKCSICGELIPEGTIHIEIPKWVFVVCVLCDDKYSVPSYPLLDACRGVEMREDLHKLETRVDHLEARY